MDKSSHPSASGGAAGGDSTSNNTRDRYLKHLNRNSQKISKPITNTTTTTHTMINKSNLDYHYSHHQPLVPQPQLSQTQSQPQNDQQHHHGPVYNINKSDFRNVVQKLTGSPAHDPFGTPPPVQQPLKPQSSRLQRFRPPPLAQISHRPPPLLNCDSTSHPTSAAPPLKHSSNPSLSLLNCAAQPLQNPNNPTNVQRQAQPMSPLPPFPAVNAAAESPISAYMRFLHNSVGVVPPQQNIPPISPLPFGLLSPSFLLSPTGQFGFQQLSPTTLPVPSPRWKGV